MTSGRTQEAIALYRRVILAAASWVVVVRQMNGMDIAVATELGSFVGYRGAGRIGHRGGWVSPLPPTSDEGDETNDEAKRRNT
jgi:hypothetical protein